MVVRGTRKKMVAIYSRVADLAIQCEYDEINRLLRIVAARSMPEVRQSAFFATFLMRGMVDTSVIDSK